MKFILTVLVAANVFFYVNACNEANCRSVVTKCLLLEACKCDLSTRLCSKECFICLGTLYTECCSCVAFKYMKTKFCELRPKQQTIMINKDMCPVFNDTSGSLDKTSHIEEFDEAVPELFNVLTEVPDELDRWLVMRYPVEIDAIKKKIKPPHEKNGTIRQSHDSPDEDDDVFIEKTSLNCVVIFWGQCMSWGKCRNHCISMGSSSYRWFHNGCCECVGPECINYGINESKCKLCQSKDGDNEKIDGALTFGEDNPEEDGFAGDYDDENYDDLREEDFADLREEDFMDYDLDRLMIEGHTGI